MRIFSRIAGALTIGYSVAVVAKPELMAKPCELTERDGSVPTATAMLIRALCVRDTLSGISLMIAPPGRALRIAGAIRAGSDATDALLFGTALPSAEARKKAATVALGWASACAAAVAAAEPDAPKRERLTR